MIGLANALPASSDALKALVVQADVTLRQISLVRFGKPINAGAYLALCGALGIDPIDGSVRPIKTVSSNVEWWLLGTALSISRGLRRLDQRSAPKTAGVSPSTICRVESSKPVNIANMIKVCGFIGVHPDGYTAPVNWPPGGVSRETPTETSCSNLENRHGDAAHT